MSSGCLSSSTPYLMPKFHVNEDLMTLARPNSAAPAGKQLEPVSSRSSLPSTTPSSSSVQRRRSVSSMKELMPLALSPASSNAGSSTVSTGDGMAGRRDDYLPELLARDLEISKDVFSAKNMTAGSPASFMLSEDRGRGLGNKNTPSSPYLAASARVQTLGAIEERESLASFIGQNESVLYDHTSESASASSHHSSEEAEPPSFRQRSSVLTNATSLPSPGYKSKTSPTTEDPSKRSWMDGDSDPESHGFRDVEESHLDALVSRPATPSVTDLGFVSNSHTATNFSGLWESVPRSVHRKSHSVSGGFPVSPGSQRPGTSVELPLRSGSMTGGWTRGRVETIAKVSSQTFSSSRQRSLSRIEGTKFSQIINTMNAFSGARDELPGVPVDMSHGLSPMSDDLSDFESEPMHQSAPRSIKKINPAIVQAPTAPEPIRSVETWLDSSLQPYPWTFQNEDSAKVVPLPPDAVETIRVSVVCFPETMLLTTSLTVETIRSYARKVRQPSMDAFDGSDVDSPAQSPRKSLWRKVVTYKRGSQLHESKPLRRGQNSRHGSSIDSSSSSSESDNPRSWLPIKNVFGSCSDYICDALYAHIVAYNYVSLLLGRRSVNTSSHGRPSTALSIKESSQQEDIPKKAAMLLGLTPRADLATGGGKAGKRLASPPASWTKEGMVTRRENVATSQDAALRVIQIGLLRCISRLVATAKLMAENEMAEERAVSMDAEDTDMLLLKSLCEIVRMAEESL